MLEREDWEPGDTLMMEVMQPPPALTLGWVEVKFIRFTDRGRPVVRLASGETLICHERIALRHVD